MTSKERSTIVELGWISCQCKLESIFLDKSKNVWNVSKDLLLYLAVNGSRYSKIPSQYALRGVPKVPCTVEEVVNDVKACTQAGVRLIHVHSRGTLGEHQADPGWYSKL